jgi:hypothetical protein
MTGHARQARHQMRNKSLTAVNLTSFSSTRAQYQKILTEKPAFSDTATQCGLIDLSPGRIDNSLR